MKNSMLYKNLDHKYMTLEDIIKEAKGEDADVAKTEETKAEETKTDAEESKDADAKEEEKTRIFYVTDEVQQSQYINMFKAQGQDAIILTHNIDSAFITYLEQKHQEVQFLRIDADVHDSLKDEVAEDEKEEFQKTTDSLVEIFRKELGNEKLDVKVEKLKDENVASMAVLSEENRRMQEMMKMYGMGGMDASMPPIPYIFIISCILLFSSERTAIDATFSSLSFSTLTSSFSLPSSLRKISTRLSVVFWNSSFSSSATSSFRESCTSASILKN